MLVLTHRFKFEKRAVFDPVTNAVRVLGIRVRNGRHTCNNIMVGFKACRKNCTVQLNKSQSFHCVQ